MIGESIGSYRIVAKLGEGGMGAVYLGEHQRIARKVAIKVLLPALSHDQRVVDRFFNEARATSLIRHPGIVEVSDCDVLPSGNAYIVMEFLEGESLGNCLRRVGRLSVPRALVVARNIADALEAAHAQRIIHRDLKPDNVFLLPTAVGASAQPIKILDFGIAKLMHTNAGDGHYKTRTGSLVGTPVYMSPEQCRGVGTIDLRTDIYSLGCMLFEMLCGHPPFTSEGFGELIQSHLSVTPPRVRSIDPALSEAVDGLVARMLAKSPDDRPQTMRALVGELEPLAAARPWWPASPTSRLGAPNAVGVSNETGVSNAPAVPSARAPTVKIDDPGVAPTGGVGSAGGTMVLPTPAPMRMPIVRTTLGSASSERIPVVGLTGEAEAPKPRGGGRLWAAAALVAVVGGLGIWRATKHDSDAPTGGSSAAGAPAATLPVTPSAPSTAPRIATPEATVTPPPIATPREMVTPRPTERPTPTPSPPRERKVKVKVVIASEPSGADVCLKKDRVLLGRTKFSWSTDKSPHGAKLLIRKRGYRGQEISVVPDREVKQLVTLDKLGPDDIDDVDNCEKR